MESEKNNIDSVRVDKWLWSVRICKTRAIATDLCRRNKVSVRDEKVKPSRAVKVGQIITVRRDGLDWQYKVLRCIEKRVGPALAVECREDLNSQDQMDRLKVIKSAGVPQRAKGAGRPTKKDRRTIERLNPDRV